MDVLQPIPDMNAKLESDMAKQIEKAEKTAKSLVANATRKVQAEEAKEQKKRKKSQKVQEPWENIEMEVKQAEMDVLKAEQEEQKQADVTAAIQKAVAAITKPSTVPLTVMVTNDAVPKDAASRTKILQELLEAKKKEMESGVKPSTSEASASDASSMYGVQGVLAVLRRAGTLRTKTKKSKDDRHCVNDVLKMGKHLLK